MRIAIISDIHSNLIALQAVLHEIEQLWVDKIICLGDVVGYGPAPNECVNLIKEKVDVCLMGNHDWAVLGKENLAYFNTFAREAVLWSQKQISEETNTFLKDLKFDHQIENCMFVHSAPFEPQAWTYVLNKNDAQIQFEHLQTQLCFVGHTHVAGIFCKKDEIVNFVIEDSIKIEDDTKYIINVGSVGQPRDFDPRASFGIIDTENKFFEFRRIIYDIESTQFTMEKVGLPQYLIDRLAYGR
jgi:predicted phosphodiesterase